jgi:hypothetical protein
MDNFLFFLKLGWEHIISGDALDHQLFILALACVYRLADWRRVLLLVTAFTVGHFTTLVLSIYNLVFLPSDWVEFLIPVTIVLSAAINFKKQQRKDRYMDYKYLIALCFGFIHGMGFANYLRFILSKQETLGWPLLSFNIGLELGQVAVVILLFIIIELLIRKSSIPHRAIILTISLVTLVTGLYFSIARFPI